MAEALARHYWAESFTIASAGVSALGHIPKHTLEVLEEMEVSTSGLYSKGLEELELNSFQIILNLAGYPLDAILPPSYEGEVIYWHVRDPYQESLDAFRQTRDAIEWLVTEKVPAWMDSA
jgi:protein-tyrosine-phosphatase